ncbi:LysR family transcriptional regulator [Enterobacter kobei]|nr:LysR family transcriptional regulator [Enterobacter kobei]
MKHSFKKNELSAIVELTKHRSYSKAAKNLNIAQANLSRTITTIEERIGLKIFERDTRPIKTTKFGDKLIPLILKNLEAIDELSAFAENYKKSTGEQINIYAPSGIIYFFSKYFLNEIIKASPNLNIRLNTCNQGGTVNSRGISVMDDADITFTYFSPVNELLVAKKIATIPLGVYCNKEYSRKISINKAEDYSKYPCVLMSGYAKNQNEWTFFDTENRMEIKTEVTGIYTVDNFMAGVEIAKKNDFLVLAPDALINEQGDHNFINTLPESIVADCSIYMVYKQKAYLPYRICLLSDLITRIVGDYFNQYK